MRIYLCLGIILSCINIASAQKRLPVIKASSPLVAIRDKGVLVKDAWRISPEIKPDVYNTSKKNGRVTFYTDLDSITFTVKPSEVYDFIVLLNDKDSAFTRIRYEPAKLEILKRADKYNPADKREFPAFTYQSMEAPELVTLRKEMNLDSIAGTGTETLKILNLLHWIHNLVPHDGFNGNPVVKNAVSMIRECKRDKRGLNCRGLATVLNECYLSLGIKSRIATCMPKDSVFDDCHVVNLVYSTENKKWLWIDPTNNAYVMDEKGMLLSIEEVRERLIKGKPLILNPDANWNNKATATRQQYLEQYMAKNLYRIECPADSRYDMETAGKGKTITYIELLPLDAYHQLPQRTTKAFKDGTIFINYKTNNPALFWKLPEGE